MSKSIAQLQSEIASALAQLPQAQLPPELAPLKHLAPSGMSPRVSFTRKNRKIRSDADASNFAPADCAAVLTYEAQPDAAVSASAAKARANGASDPLADIVFALSDAERDPRFRQFVALKTFRDQFLPERPWTWAQTPEGRDRALRQAIEQRLILKRQVPNPRSPEFPTTAISLNREHPQVSAVLAATQRERSPFHPVRIRGEELSATVIAERRR
jgi:hypothetical protein